MSENSKPLVDGNEALEAVRTLLRYMGEDPDRAGLRDTPKRVLKAWRCDWADGYAAEANLELRFFKDEDAATHEWGEMVLVRDITFNSTCEHHLAPFMGVASIAYIPNRNKGVLGLSKFARIVDVFSHRLQTQERMTAQVAEFIEKNVSEHVGVVVSAEHTCMLTRGVRRAGAKTFTSALRGAFFNEAKTRAEFLRLAMPKE